MYHLLALLSDRLLNPLSLLLILLLTGLRSDARAARRTLLAAVLLLLALAWTAPADALLATLEDQTTPYARHDPEGVHLGDYAGVVVLGGAIKDARLWTRPGQLPLRESAERMVAAANIARQQPDLPMIFTGGSSELGGNGRSEAEGARLVFAALGLAPNRVRYEAASRNTHENAVFCARLPGVDPQRPWLLLTTASHMPRALAAFRHTGWNVSPYPVDYRTAEHDEGWRLDWNSSLSHWRLALHEWVGLITYRLRGWA
ncbi:MAG: YdcF family protein [Pseudomonadota bacterium]|nr:YdcF family protein [Pseudomonadota bacterium]